MPHLQFKSENFIEYCCIMYKTFSWTRYLNDSNIYFYIFLLLQEIGIKNYLHRKKLQLALQSVSTNSTEKFNGLDHNWVTRMLSNYFWYKVIIFYRNIDHLSLTVNIQHGDNLTTFLARLFEEEKVDLLSSLRHQSLGRLRFRLIFFVRVHFSKTIKGIHLKLGILVHYQKRNQLQQGR
jgi:hypothetical protein